MQAQSSPAASGKGHMRPFPPLLGELWRPWRYLLPDYGLTGPEKRGQMARREPPSGERRRRQPSRAGPTGMYMHASHRIESSCGCRRRRLRSVAARRLTVSSLLLPLVASPALTPPPSPVSVSVGCMDGWIPLLRLPWTDGSISIVHAMQAGWPRAKLC